MKAPDFTLRQLEYFVAVADHETIGRAAEVLHASPSAVGAALTELERHIGERLTVRRRAHGVSLTTAGRTFLPRARDLLTAAHDLTPVPDGELTGRLAVGCYQTFAASLLPSLIEGFETRHPAVRLDFVEHGQDVLLQALDQGQIDVAILYDRDIRGDLATRELYGMPAYALLSADHRLATSEAVSLRELVDEPFVQFDVQPAWQNTQALMNAAGVHPQVRYITSNYELTRSLVGRGLAYTVLVHRPASDFTHEGRRVVMKELTPAPTPTTIVLAWPREVPPAPLLRAFLDWAPGQVRNERSAEVSRSDRRSANPATDHCARIQYPVGRPDAP